ncbi:VOC family protein [Algicola sagamiensis]|uniref:VOC family protein n=1 Tax=Algicola sagamiensis TaxID=163869 RepID=UPI000399950F|nr:hypothetical protein [Algicola sagamiensis]
MYQLDHIVLNSTNVEKTMKFYGKVLDMLFVHWQEYLDGERHFPALRLSPTCVIDIFPPEMWQKKALKAHKKISTIFVLLRQPSSGCGSIIVFNT